VINRTRLSSTHRKVLDDNSGGKRQTGETAFGVSACGEAQVLRRMRAGAEIGEPMLRKMDEFLSDRGY
jgi:hypothetical protein